MVFVFDLDDTICDSDGYSEFYIAKFFVENNLPYKQIAKIVRFAEMKFDWDTDTAIKWYREFGDQMMLEFPQKDNSIELINKLHDAGHKIIIATARSNDWHSDPEGITLKWLKNVDLKYDKVYIGRNDKEEICKIEKADVFIDDDVKITARVAEYFKEIGHGVSFLKSTEYNKTLEISKSVVRVNSLEDMIEYIKLNSMKELI